MLKHVLGVGFLLGTSAGRTASEIALIVICVLMGAYLFAALLWPEKF
jgi:K+-transporting ATPase KdpF subunit